MYALIAEKGYDNASIGQIADRIGIKKASVYYYFSSKQDILLELVQTIYQEDYRKRLGRIQDCRTTESYKAALLELGRDFVSSYFQNQTLRKVYAEIDIQTSRIPRLQALVRQMNQELKDFLVQVLLYGVEIGAFWPEFDADGKAQMLYVLLIGMDDAILYELPAQPDVVWEAAVGCLFS